MPVSPPSSLPHPLRREFWKHLHGEDNGSQQQMTATQAPEDSLGPPRFDQAVPNPQPQPVPMGMPMGLQNHSLSQPAFAPQPQFVNPPMMPNSSGIMGHNMSAVPGPGPGQCLPNCGMCSNARNNNGLGNALALNRFYAPQNQIPLGTQQAFASSNQPSMPSMPLQMNTGHPNLATRPATSAISGPPPLLPPPAPSVNPPMHNPPKFNALPQNLYGESQFPKPNQVPQMPPQLSHGPGMGPSNNYLQIYDLTIPELPPLPGSFPQNMAGRPQPAHAPQPMPMPNQFNDARGQNPMIPLSGPHSVGPGNHVHFFDPYVAERSKPSLNGSFTPYAMNPPKSNPISSVKPPSWNEPVWAPPPAPPAPPARPQTSGPGVLPITPPTLPMGQMPLQAIPPPRPDELDLARQFGYINLNSDGLEPPKTPVTPKDLQDAQKDLTPLAREIHASAKPFDNSYAIRSHLIKSYALPYPWEWCLSLRTHTCILTPRKTC